MQGLIKLLSALLAVFVLGVRDMILIELLSLVTMFLSSTTSLNVELKEDDFTKILHAEPEMSPKEPLCDVHTSFIFHEMNICGKKRKILNGNQKHFPQRSIRQRVRIVKCLGLNASWALKNTVRAECLQNYVDVKLYCIGKIIKS